MKYGKAITKKICDLIREDTYNITEICGIVGINKDTYYEWLKTKSDFSDAIARAEIEQKHLFKAKAKRSMQILIDGIEYEETKTVIVSAKGGREKKTEVDENTATRKGEVKEVTKIKKYIPPNVTAVIYTLENADAENWKSRKSIELTGAGGKDLIPSADYSKLSKKDLALLHSLHEKAKPSET